MEHVARGVGWGGGGDVASALKSGFIGSFEFNLTNYNENASFFRNLCPLGISEKASEEVLQLGGGGGRL